jgi:hypothetical protein
MLREMHVIKARSRHFFYINPRNEAMHERKIGSLHRTRRTLAFPTSASDPRIPDKFIHILKVV